VCQSAVGPRDALKLPARRQIPCRSPILDLASETDPTIAADGQRVGRRFIAVELNIEGVPGPTRSQWALDILDRANVLEHPEEVVAKGLAP